MTNPRAAAALRAIACAVFPIALALGASDSAADFVQSDLSGTWSTYTRSDDSAVNAPGTRYGTTVIDATGNVTGGSATDETGATNAHTGGSFAVDPFGAVDGSVANANETDAFAGFQLDLSATLLVGVDSNPDGSVGFESAVKQSGVFSTADLVGRWEYVGHWDLPMANNTPGYDALQIEIDAGGVVRSVASRTAPTGHAPMVVDTTQFTIGSDGAVDITTLPDAQLQMSPNKQVMLGVMRDASNYVVGAALIRDDGSGFTAADLAGQWHYYSFWDRNPAAQSATYAEGVLQLDASGNALSGTWDSLDFGSFTVVSGGLAINSGGTISGQVDLSAGGGILTFADIHLNADGNFGAGTYRSGTAQVFTFFVLPEPSAAASSVASLAPLAGFAALRCRRRTRRASAN